MINQNNIAEILNTLQVHSPLLTHSLTHHKNVVNLPFTLLYTYSLTFLIQGSIKSVNNNEINYLITNAIVNLDRKRADIAVITGIISNFSGNSYVNIDSVTYTSYMDILNRRGKYEETLNIFDDMKVSYSLTHSFIHSLIYSLSHSLTHSLTLIKG